MFSCLMSRQSRINCQFHVKKMRIYGLMISEKTSTKIILNDLLGAVVIYVAVQFFRKKLAF